MSSPINETINTVAQAVLAICAFAALCLGFWNSPRPGDQKKALLVLLAQLTALAAVSLCAYLLLATDNVLTASVLALYVFLVQSAVFSTLKGPITRFQILTMIVGAVFVGMVPLMGTSNALVRTQLEMETISIVGKMAQRLRPTPTPTSSPLRPHP
jgi:hypothetical protein